jgi:metallo-beta-lactamase class B
MNRKAYGAIALTVLFIMSFGAANGSAQGTANTVEAHVAAAKAAAGQEYARMFENLCSAPAPPAAQPAAARPYPPPSSEWDAEPAKVFDNLYYVGSKGVGSWAVTTSEGIIILDALFEYSVEEEIVNGLKKLGLDPGKIKYVVVSHAHGDHYAGAPFLQDRLKAPILMSAADWDYIASQRNPSKPRRDRVVTDGQKLTLGDTTITMYLTPGHTPGTISFLVPVWDGSEQHLASMWGGTAFNFPRTAENFRIYANSAQRFADIVRQNPVDIVLTNHPDNSRVHEKIAGLKGRQSYEPHPFVVGKDSQLNHLKVASECAQAQMLRVGGAANR